MTKPQAEALTPKAAAECTAYILEWLERRNGAELAPALEAMRVIDRRLMQAELVHILQHGGKPENWIA